MDKYANSRVYLYGMTDSILAGMLPALPPNADRYDWTYILIAGEERRRHHKLTMWPLPRGWGRHRVTIKWPPPQGY